MGNVQKPLNVNLWETAHLSLQKVYTYLVKHSITTKNRNQCIGKRKKTLNPLPYIFFGSISFLLILKKVELLAVDFFFVLNSYR